MVEARTQDNSYSNYVLCGRVTKNEMTNNLQFFYLSFSNNNKID